MHLRHLTIGLTLALTMGAHAPAATVYKWIDSNGVVHYSDQPEPGSQRIVTDSSSQSARGNSPSTPATRPTPARDGRKGQPGDPPQSALDYTAFSIEMPMPEQNFSDTIVPVRVHLEPYLHQGHAMSLYLDGKLVENQPKNALEFALTDVPRGSHMLVANVMDTDTGESKNSPGITFYVQRPSLLSPLRKKK